MSVLTPAPLADRRERREDELALGAFVVGLVAVLVATVVPAVPPATGLVVGGLLAGLAAQSLARALQLGLYFGGLVLVCWGVALVLFGVLGPVLAATPLSVLAVVLGVVLPTLAAVAVRGLV
ncbi:MAG: hypothetical protein ABEJ05_08665 [Haloglomus sp.]